MRNTTVWFAGCKDLGWNTEYNSEYAVKHDATSVCLVLVGIIR